MSYACFVTCCLVVEAKKKATLANYPMPVLRSSCLVKVKRQHVQHMINPSCATSCLVKAKKNQHCPVLELCAQHLYLFVSAVIWNYATTFSPPKFVFVIN